MEPNSSYNDVHIINYPSREIGKRWYSKQDERDFKERAGRDAVHCSRQLVHIRENIVDKMKTMKFLVQCVGLEHLLSRTSVSNQVKSVRMGRKKHASVVLEEQKKQKKSNVFSVVMLAHVSNTSSENVRKKAHTRARMAAQLKY